MSETKYTPGPWVAIHEPGHSSKDMIDNGGYRIDAPNERVTQLAFVWVLNQRVPADGGPQVDGPHFGDVRAGANARLIAAAPEMLEALQAQMEATILLLSKYQYSQQEIEDCTSQARAAIDRAQGA